MAAIDDFEDLGCIGRGGFGEVLRCRRRADGRIFALPAEEFAAPFQKFFASCY